MFNKNKQEIEELKSSIEYKDSVISTLGKNYQDAVDKNKSMLQDLKSQNFKFGVLGSKHTLILGAERAAGVTTFIKSTLIPNLNGSVAIIDGTREFSDNEDYTHSSQFDVFNINQVRNNLRDSDDKRLCQNLKDWIKSKDENTTIIIDNIEFLNMLYDKDEMSTILRLIQEKNYIISATSMRNIKNLFLLNTNVPNFLFIIGRYTQVPDYKQYEGIIRNFVDTNNIYSITSRENLNQIKKTTRIK